MNIRYIAGVTVILAVLGLAFYLAGKSAPAPKTSLIQWRSFNDGVVAAKQSHKKLLVDVYTDWCGWCKKMDADVYANQGVAQLINENFIAIKLNAESSGSVTYNGTVLSESEMARSMGVTGYPTTVFFDSAANPITNLDGFVDSDRFTKILDYIGQDHYRSGSFQDYLARSK